MTTQREKDMKAAEAKYADWFKTENHSARSLAKRCWADGAAFGRKDVAARLRHIRGVYDFTPADELSAIDDLIKELENTNK